MRTLILVMSVWALLTGVGYGQSERESQEAMNDSRLRQAEDNAKVQEEKVGAAAYDTFKEPYRTRFVNDWEAEVKRIKEEIKSYPAKARNVKSKYGTKTAAKEARRYMDSLKKKLKQLEKNEPPFIRDAPFRPRDWQVGTYGRVFLTSFMRPVQIINETEMLVDLQDPYTGTSVKWVMFSGFPTAGITDDDKAVNIQGVEFHKPIQITGTTTYGTAAGSTKTVLVVKPLDLDSLKKEPAAPKEEENKIEKGLPDRASDTRILLGRWQVSVMDYRAIWTFRQDGVVLSSTSSPGRWSIEGEIVHITWSPKFWESFHRPLDALHTTGDSWKGPDKLIAVKVK